MILNKRIQCLATSSHWSHKPDTCLTTFQHFLRCLKVTSKGALLTVTAGAQQHNTVGLHLIPSELSWPLRRNIIAGPLLPCHWISWYEIWKCYKSFFRSYKNISTDSLGSIAWCVLCLKINHCTEFKQFGFFRADKNAPNFITDTFYYIENP